MKAQKQTLKREQVLHVAKLANLPLTDAEVAAFAEQLSDTIASIATLDEVKTDGVEPTSQVTGLVNILDDDTPRPSLPNDVALKNAKSITNGSFKVKAIF